ncbi:CPBP family glutamic-type intramembrane protease [Chryseobacterium carnipullorum]|uniref:CPBP family glutamic-type intramembrane protease n=1 Tax=Chryseobacterium carnipullorum TaxID=1124835 RepID=UPI000E912DAF|nr:CPBP family glutamic-type intramembrane protease [Chryseobacterium carnipullorum]HBV16301.1 hypothetical protein [Chryseobacterium carnipullorum]
MSNFFFIDFFKFIYKPDIYKSSNSVLRKICESLFIYLFSLLLGLCISFTIYYFIDTPERRDNEVDFSFEFIFLSCLLLPLLEEIVFRLSFIYSRINLSLSVGGIAFSIANNLLKEQTLFTIENFYVIRIIASILISIFIGILFYFKIKRYTNVLANFHQKKFKTIFYILTLLFALLHVTNFKLNFYSFLIFPLMILPQFIFGLAAGFIRIRYGFPYCLFIHIFSNAIPTLFIYFYFK